MQCFVKTTSPGLQNDIDHFILSFQSAFHFPTFGTWCSPWLSSQRWPKNGKINLCCNYDNIQIWFVNHITSACWGQHLHCSDTWPKSCNIWCLCHAMPPISDLLIWGDMTWLKTHDEQWTQPFIVKDVRTYINSGLEGVPNTPRGDAGVVDVGQAGGSPESHLKDRVKQVCNKIKTLTGWYI